MAKENGEDYEYPFRHSVILDLLSKPFPEEDLEWRIGRCGKKGNGQIWASCFAYVTARAIQDRLDDVVGPSNWQVSYHTLGDVSGASKEPLFTPGIICKLSLRIDGEWVTKEDGAEQTDMESFKGGLSSALKRAAVLWSLGRYLYKLESAFAVVTEDKRGAMQGSGKDKKTGEMFYFYWIPPALPAWALPEAKRDGALTRVSVKPEQPKPGDGHQSPSPSFEDFR